MNSRWTRVFALMEEPNQSRCSRLYEENREVIDKARGSKSKHQAWEGGYIDHVCEVIWIAEEMFATLNKFRTLDFSLADAVLVLFLHDIEKPWKHKLVDGKYVDDYEVSWSKTNFVLNKIKAYGIELTEAQMNAILYCEGEKEAYDPNKNVQMPLAAFCNCCDLISARIWHNYPRKN